MTKSWSFVIVVGTLGVGRNDSLFAWCQEMMFKEQSFSRWGVYTGVKWDENVRWRAQRDGGSRRTLKRRVCRI